MRGIRISVAGLMTLVLILALDFTILRAIPSVMNLASRLAIFGGLPMAHLMLICLVGLVRRMLSKGEIPLSGVMFLLCGGTATLALAYVALLVPETFYEYIRLTAFPIQNLFLTQAQRTSITQGRMMPPIYAFGMGRINPFQMLLAGTILTPPLLIPALVGGWAGRGYRLKLLKPGEAAEVGQPVHNIEIVQGRPQETPE